MLNEAEPLTEAEWLPGEQWQRVYMGLQTDPSSGDPNLLEEHPKEGCEDGCPGGWYRCAFTDSLRPFEPLCSEGQYQRCYELDECDSRIIHEWVRLLQTEQMRHSAHEMSLWSPAKPS